MTDTANVVELTDTADRLGDRLAADAPELGYLYTGVLLTLAALGAEGVEINLSGRLAPGARRVTLRYVDAGPDEHLSVRFVDEKEGPTDD